MPSLRSLAWNVAVHSRAVDFLHRAAPKPVLTVLGLHRVLAADDPSRPWALPEFTIDPMFFERALDYLGRRYTVVDLGRVIEAGAGGRPLPARALLLTIDDGWRDAVEVAAPLLARKGMPSVLFVVASAIGSEHGLWQNELHARVHFNAPADLRAALKGRNEVAVRAESWERRDLLVDALMEALEPLSPHRRREMLSLLGDLPAPSGGRQFASAAELRGAAESGMTIGAHGMTHERLTGAVDLSQELEGARALLADALTVAPESITAMSFPHGRYGPDIVRQAHEAGFSALFTSELTLNPLSAGVPTSPLFGRLWIGQAALGTSDGQLRTVAASARLLRAPVAAPGLLPSPWFRA